MGPRSVSASRRRAAEGQPRRPVRPGALSHQAGAAAAADPSVTRPPALASDDRRRRAPICCASGSVCAVHKGDGRASRSTKRARALALAVPIRQVMYCTRAISDGGFGEPRSHVGGPPPGNSSHDAQLVAPATGCATNRATGQHIDHAGWPTPGSSSAARAARAVDAGLSVVFRDEGAEQAVPNDQDAAVVAVG